jgi:glycosyltransferase involved in cell wall biosynthesis
MNTAVADEELRQISTVIIAQDEEVRLATAVRSCQCFSDEVLVVDGGSRDGTAELAHTLGCRVIRNPWPGYAAQRNFGAAAANYDWIFFLDADEEADAHLQLALLAWKHTPTLAAAAFAVCRVGNFFDRWLDNKPEHPIRLYDRRVHRLTDVPVHERIAVGEAPVARLPGTLRHHGFRSVADHIERFNRYTSLEAEQAAAEHRPFSPLRLLGRPPARFLQMYFLSGMVRRGLAGLTVAVLWSYYEFLREIKLYELTRETADRPAVTPSHLGSPRP